MTLSADTTYPMPYCQCIDLEYTPAGPDLPNEVFGETFDYFSVDTEAAMTGFCIDIGDVPFSAPGFGWYCKSDAQPVFSKMALQSIDNIVAVSMTALSCCELVATPDDPLFTGSVLMLFDPDLSAYVANIGNRKYIMKVIKIGGWSYFILYEGIYSPTTGHLNVFLTYQASMNTPAAPRENSSEVR
jgi:hypothetical protein